MIVICTKCAAEGKNDGFRGTDACNLRVPREEHCFALFSTDDDDDEMDGPVDIDFVGVSIKTTV